MIVVLSIKVCWLAGERVATLLTIIDPMVWRGADIHCLFIGEWRTGGGVVYGSGS